jgi:hypothetical protein
MDRRIALDGEDLPYPVVVVSGRVWDAALYPFENIRGEGTPVEQVRFRDGATGGARTHDIRPHKPTL